MTSIEAPLRPPFSGSASRRTWTRPPLKPGPSKPVTRSARPPISTSPWSGRRSAPASGSVAASRLLPERTTTSAPVTRSTSSRVLLRADRGEREHARGAAAGVEQAGARGRQRVAAAGLEAPRLLQRHDAAADAVVARELVKPVLDRAALPGLDRLGELPVPRDHARGLLRLVLLLAEQAGRGALRLGEPRVGLALLGVGREHEPDGRDHDHRQDDQDDEEDGESVAKAHSGTGRPASLAAPRLQSARRRTTVRYGRPFPGL